MASKMRGKAHECKHSRAAVASNTCHSTRTGVKPYTCKYCKKCFSQSSQCKEHERSHTRVKPYTCKHCKKCFSRLRNCKEHERIHTGEKPYTCKYCEKCFSQLSTYKRHEEIHVMVNSLEHNKHGQPLKRRNQEPSTTHGGKKSSLTEENSSQIESLTCWICQEECSSMAGLIQHYNDHMR